MSEKNSAVRCEDCLYFDYDEELEEECCQLDLDEDDFFRLASSHHASCPYYRFYDEYKLVQKQN